MPKLEQAMFGAGCFWGVESLFRKLPGIHDVAVGYAGGHTDNPTYEEVCGNNTGHAEVVWMLYDPEEISYTTLLDTFFNNHNPTTLNQQGPDIGSQYRSVIFCYSEEQKKEAQAAKLALENSKKWPHPIVTEIESAPIFYKAEEYHQRYLEKRGQDHCGI
jgi:peptide-methionine (S)-S-oxide reductase